MIYCVMFLFIFQETPLSPYWVILHNKRFMKVPRTKLQQADENVAFKDSWKVEPDQDVNYSEK